jgi:hypothetical protein
VSNIAPISAILGSITPLQTHIVLPSLRDHRAWEQNEEAFTAKARRARKNSKQLIWVFSRPSRFRGKASSSLALAGVGIALIDTTNRLDIFAYEMSQPPQVPPFSSVPAGYAAYSPVRMSAMAVTSLVFGVLLCIPIVAGLAAIIFGIAGILATRNPSIRGRGMAVAGLILGLVNIAGSVGVSVVYWQTTTPMRAAARQFVYDVSKPNLPAAYAEGASPLADSQVKDLSDWFGKRGAMNSMRVTGAYIQYNNGFESGTVSCTVQFADGTTANGEIGLLQSNGIWKVIRAQFQ